MPLIRYQDKKFTAAVRTRIEQVNAIITAFRADGYILTVRQVYYQLVGQGLIPNNFREYKKIVDVIANGRRAGLIDWNAIEDRTRNLVAPPSWSSPASIVDVCARTYDVDWWDNQPCYVEWWVEKEALVGILEKACRPWRCPYFACRGYASDSEVWAAGVRFKERLERGQEVRVFHMSDHDPSGVDMTADLRKRLELFAEEEVEVVRVALTMAQVELYNPPPNPAKPTDIRFKAYEKLYGDQSWELDALTPAVVHGLVDLHTEELIDQDKWQEAEERRDAGRRRLKELAAELREEEDDA